ncbi:hypothetical protein [Halomonas sp. QHL1]|uniref:hypothetical protein n=1 Tax=Halomonas sp. QHL1 TaxID=1123773 RepID=UPI001587C0DD|nr:hypothetical protein [Halomonas sp. QHL1]
MLATFSITPINSYAVDLALYNSVSEDDEDSVIMDVYLKGLGEGLIYSYTLSKSMRLESPFCPPDNLIISADIVRTIVDGEILSPSYGMEYNSDTFLALITTVGFKNFFPCN